MSTKYAIIMPDGTADLTMKSTFLHSRVIAIIAAGLLFTILFAPAAGGHEIAGWGDNGEGATTPPDGNNFIAIAASGDYNGDYSIALKSDGRIVGWGYNSFGQAAPPDGNNFIALAAGGYHGLAIKSNGSIVGWGRNNYGQATPPAGNNFTAVAAGMWHGLALKSDGSIVGWGNNTYDQVTPPAGNDFIAIAAGGFYSLALKSDGSIVGWGYNDYGQATPPDGNNFIAVAAGYNHGIALESDGSIAGWGGNDHGEARPPAGKNFIAVAAGTYYGIALKSDGSIVGWGNNNSGQATPPAGKSFIAIAAGGSHGLALREALTIIKCAVTAGSKDSSDTISFSGTMNATADDLPPAGSIEVTIDSNDMANPCVKTFPINSTTFKNGKFKCSASNASFALDTKTTKFSFTTKGVDLSGLSCPLTVQIKTGDYNATVEVNETVVNGTKPIPINLMMGTKNVLRVDKCQVKQNDKKSDSDQLTVRGGFAVEDVNVSMADRVSEDLVVTLDTQIFIIPKSALKAGTGKFTCSKAEVTGGGVAAANFDFNKCAFTLTIKDVNIPVISGTVDFGAAFADYNEVALITLP